MPIRFNRSVKIAPGMRLNFSGSGTSLSVGGRGATVNFSKRGTRTTLGIPGTGLSHSFSSRTPSRRAIDRRQEREERERVRAEALSRIRVSVDDEGVLTCLDAHGSSLRGRDLTLLWEQEGEAIRALLLSTADNINGDVELLNGIHLDMPHPSPATLLDPVPVAEFAPRKPNEEHCPEEPRFMEPKPPGLLSRFFGGKRRHAKRAAEARDSFDVRHEAWRSRCVAVDSENEVREENWRHAHAKWMEKVERNRLENIEREKAHRENLRHDSDYADAVIQEALTALEWPRETLIAHRVDAANHTIWIDLDLPEIEDLPQRVASLASSGKKLTVKAKPQKTLRMEYARHVHGIALRIATTVAAAVPWTEMIVVSGYSQRLDTATGVIRDDYLLSVMFTRSGLQEIDYTALERVDPIEAVAAFENRRRMTTTGIFKPVEPFAPAAS